MGVSANQLTLAGFNLLNEAVDPTTAHT
jgi:hypothetical protein